MGGASEAMRQLKERNRKRVREERQADQTLWMPLDVAEDAPFAPRGDLGVVLLLFGTEEHVQGWIDRTIASDRVVPFAIKASGIERLVDDYASQIEYFSHVKDGELRGAIPEFGFDLVETEELWKLKMWAQYVQGKPGWRDTLNQKAV